jgi:hypothetical protein
VFTLFNELRLIRAILIAYNNLGGVCEGKSGGRTPETPPIEVQEEIEVETV